MGLLNLFTHNIKVKYFDEKCKIEKTKRGDWIDLRSREEVFLKAGEYRKIKLGVAIEAPKGYECHIAPRSSTYKEYHTIQVNSVAVIDHVYCGDDDEWMVPVLAMEDTTIHKYDRICQFRTVKSMRRVRIIPKTHLGNKNRGGFGTSGNT